MEWVAVEWVRKPDLFNHELAPVSIHLLHSPFYEGERYAVRRGAACLNHKSEWEFEPIPSSRDDAFYKRCRFKTFQEARAALFKQEAR